MVKLIHFDDEDVNDTDLEIYGLVVKVASRYGVDPLMSRSSEEFFGNLLAQYSGDLDSLAAWLEEQIPKHFVAVGERPRWIQNPEWPFADGQPMIFVGQIDMPAQPEGMATELFHDDTSLYVFIGRKVQPVVVTQQF